MTRPLAAALGLSLVTRASLASEPPRPGRVECAEPDAVSGGTLHRGVLRGGGT